MSGTDLLDYMRQRGLITRRYDFHEGVILGLGAGFFFSFIAGLRLLTVAASRGGVGEVFVMWGLATAFYLSVGVLGGLIFGALRPLRDGYWGKFLTAYLILFLVYGGGTAAVFPLIKEDPVPLRVLIPLWAVLCLVLAPIYVRTTWKW